MAYLILTIGIIKHVMVVFETIMWYFKAVWTAWFRLFCVSNTSGSLMCSTRKTVWISNGFKHLFTLFSCFCLFPWLLSLVLLLGGWKKFLWNTCIECLSCVLSCIRIVSLLNIQNWSTLCKLFAKCWLTWLLWTLWFKCASYDSARACRR